MPIKFRNYVLTIKDNTQLEDGDYFITHMDNQQIDDNPIGEETCFFKNHHRTQKVKCLNTNDIYLIPTKLMSLFELGNGCYNGTVIVEDIRSKQFKLCFDQGKIASGVSM